MTITPRVSRRYGAPTSYVVRATQDASRSCTITAPATSCEVTGLTPSSPYTFTAAARLETWETAASSASNAVTPGMAPSNTVPPSISGTAKVREALTALPGTWSGTPSTFTYTYQWQRCTTNSGSCGDITGADTTSYLLQPADVGAFIRVQVTAANGWSTSGVAHSAAPFAGPVEAPTSSSAGGTSPSAPADPIAPERATTKARATVVSALTIADREIVVRVRTNRAGRLTVTGTYPTGTTRGTARACTARAAVRRAGTHTITCPLTAPTRALLATRSLRITLRTTFTPTTGAPVMNTRTVRAGRFTPFVPNVTG